MISYLYNRRPDGGLLYDGDEWEKKTNGYISLGQKVYFLAANYFKNPYFKYEYLRDTSSSGITPVEFLCFNDPSVGVKAPDDLPLSRYLPGFSGEMLCRTDWDDGKDANTEWNEADRSATVTKDERQIYIKANDGKAYVNGYEEALDSPAEIKNDRIFVPLRFISEIFNSDIKWESTLRCVNLKKSTAYLYAYTGKTELISSIPVSKVTYSDWNADEIGKNTIDGDLSTLWSAQGTNHWIMYDFGTVTPVSEFKIIWNKGDQRQEIYNVEVSEDGVNFKKIIDTKAEGKAALAYEDNKFSETMNVRYVRINMFGNKKPTGTVS